VDIQHLLDRLEVLLSDSRRIGGKLIVDAQRSWDLIDQMRITIPEEVKQAQRINQERDRIIAQAKEEASRIIELAREEAGKLTEEHGLAQQAHELASTIEARARREADSIQNQADEYVLEVLSQLDADLTRTLTVVRNGMEKVKMDRRLFDTDGLEPIETGPPIQ
jgi:vacuolar-type H+-ATPase subunit H